MVDENLNLVSDPWIKVINKKNKEEKVSLLDLFKKSQTYRQLAGEMKAQDLAILRFLLAILTTVYSRYNVNGEPYSWLKIDKKTMIPANKFDSKNKDRMQEDLVNTWGDLYKNGHFGSIVSKYLLNYKNRFNLFGKRAFYQVNRKTYDSLATKTVEEGINTGTGTVAIKQINRSISESNNKPDIFSPRLDTYKNQISNDELIRWLITYQNYAGMSDKTKIVEKPSSSGWLYGLNTIFLQGNDLFHTLIFNLKLLNDTPKDSNEYPNQRPVWEWNSITDYLHQRLQCNFPNNIAELYTLWSRMIYIHWERKVPILFSAALPKTEAANKYIEPMTTWEPRGGNYVPNTKTLDNLSESMWRHFGQYVRVSSNEDAHIPGILNWVDLLKKKNKFPPDVMLRLRTINFIKYIKTYIQKGRKWTKRDISQRPVAEVDDEMRVDADVLFTNKFSKIIWPERIENEVELTKKVAGYYNLFAQNVAKLRNLSNIREIEFSEQQTNQFYQSLNRPFLNWLAGLRPSDNEKQDSKIEQWHQTLKKIAFEEARSFMHTVQPQEILGSISVKLGKNKKEIKVNVFQCFLIYERSVNKAIKKG